MQQPQLGCLLSIPAFAAGLLAVKEIPLPMQAETTDTNLPLVLPYLFCYEDFSCCWAQEDDDPQDRNACGTDSRTPDAAEAHWGSHPDAPSLTAQPVRRLLRPPLFPDKTRQDIQQLSTEASQLAILECTDRWLALFLSQAHSFSALLLTPYTDPKSRPLSPECVSWSAWRCYFSSNHHSRASPFVLCHRRTTPVWLHSYLAVPVSFRTAGLHRRANFISPLPQSHPSYRLTSQAGKEGHQDVAKGKKDSAQDLITSLSRFPPSKAQIPKIQYTARPKTCIGRATQEWQVITPLLNWLNIFFSSQESYKTLPVFSN